MKLFNDIVKDATAQSVHSVTALGNEKKRRDARRVMAQTSEMRYATDPKVALPDEEAAGDIVHSTIKFDIKKLDADKQLIFGWASVVKKDGAYIVDKQGDIIPVSELEDAAYDFVLHSRDQGDMHQRVGVGKLVESVVFTEEKQKALGVDLGMVGWWVGFKVNDGELWAAHKRGDRLEFSIGGACVPIELDID